MLRRYLGGVRWTSALRAAARGLNSGDWGEGSRSDSE